MRLTNSSSLTVYCDTSAALNFMVYLQNSLLTVPQGRPRFPRLKPDLIGLVDEQKFRERFATAWDEIISLLQAHGKDTFPYAGYESIFRDFFVSKEAYLDGYLSFNCWWVGGGGHNMVNSVRNTSAIYDFAVTQVEVKDQKLQVQVVYDDVFLSSSVDRKGFLVFSVPELEILHHTGKTTDLIEAKIRKALS